MILRLACLGWLGVWLWPATLAAQASPSSLRVEVISCVLEESAVDVSEMLAIARAELAPRELGARDASPDGAPLLRVDACHEEHLLLRSLKPLGPERRVALHDVPVEQRPRVAALALAELVIVTLSQARAQPEPPAPAPPVTPPKSNGRPLPFPDWTPVEPAPEKRPLTLGIGAEARLFTDSLDFSYGPHLDLSLPYLELSLLALFSHQREELGEYRTGLVALSPSYPFFRSRTRAQVAISVGADIGVTWGSAEPYERIYGEPTSDYAVFASGFAQLALSGPLSERAYGRIALLGGYAWGISSSQMSAGAEAAPPTLEATTTGPFASLVLGLAWAM